MVSDRRLRRRIERGAANDSGRRMPSLRALVFALLLVALLVALPFVVSRVLSAPEPPHPEPTTTAAASSAQGSPSASQASVSASSGGAATSAVPPTGALSDGSDVDEDKGPQKVSGPEPTQPPWGKAEAAKAKDSATRAARAFTDTSKGAAAWFRQLSPTLDPDARAGYSHTDPSNVPFYGVKKVGEPVQNKTYSQFVTVPVQAEGGSFTVELKYSADFTRFGVTSFKFGDQP